MYKVSHVVIKSSFLIIKATPKGKSANHISFVQPKITKISLSHWVFTHCTDVTPSNRPRREGQTWQRCYKEARIRGNRRGRGHKREFQNVMRFLRGSSVRRCDVAQHLWASSAALSGWSCGSTQQRNQRGADTTRSVGDWRPQIPDLNNPEAARGHLDGTNLQWISDHTAW